MLQRFKQNEDKTSVAQHWLELSLRILQSLPILKDLACLTTCSVFKVEFKIYCQVYKHKDRMFADPLEFSWQNYQEHQHLDGVGFDFGRMSEWLIFLCIPQVVKDVGTHRPQAVLYKMSHQVPAENQQEIQLDRKMRQKEVWHSLLKLKLP